MSADMAQFLFFALFLIAGIITLAKSKHSPATEPAMRLMSLRGRQEERRRLIGVNDILTMRILNNWNEIFDKPKKSVRLIAKALGLGSGRSHSVRALTLNLLIRHGLAKRDENPKMVRVAA